MVHGGYIRVALLFTEGDSRDFDLVEESVDFYAPYEDSKMAGHSVFLLYAW